MDITPEFRKRMIIELIEALKDSPSFCNIAMAQIKDAVLSSEQHIYSISRNRSDYLLGISEKLHRIRQVTEANKYGINNGNIGTGVGQSYSDSNSFGNAPSKQSNTNNSTSSNINNIQNQSSLYNNERKAYNRSYMASPKQAHYNQTSSKVIQSNSAQNNTTNSYYPRFMSKEVQNVSNGFYKSPKQEIVSNNSTQRSPNISGQIRSTRLSQTNDNFPYQTGSSATEAFNENSSGRINPNIRSRSNSINNSAVIESRSGVFNSTPKGNANGTDQRIYKDFTDKYRSYNTANVYNEIKEKEMYKNIETNRTNSFNDNGHQVNWKDSPSSVNGDMRKISRHESPLIGDVQKTHSLADIKKRLEMIRKTKNLSNDLTEFPRSEISNAANDAANSVNRHLNLDKNLNAQTSNQFLQHNTKNIPDSLHFSQSNRYPDKFKQISHLYNPTITSTDQATDHINSPSTVQYTNNSPSLRVNAVDILKMANNSSQSKITVNVSGKDFAEKKTNEELAENNTDNLLYLKHEVNIQKNGISGISDKVNIPMELEIYLRNKKLEIISIANFERWESLINDIANHYNNNIADDSANNEIKFKIFLQKKYVRFPFIRLEELEMESKKIHFQQELNDEYSEKNTQDYRRLNTQPQNDIIQCKSIIPDSSGRTDNQNENYEVDIDNALEAFKEIKRTKKDFYMKLNE